MLFLNQNVVTPYGRGIYLGVSADPLIWKVQPTQWTMARESKPTFFLNPKDVQPMYIVGTHVFLTYGEGTIIAYREEDNMYVVQLLNWQLAQGQSPSLYLQESALSLDAPKEYSAKNIEVPVPKVSHADTCIANAILIKEKAGAFYKAMDYQTARDQYLKALEAMQYLGDSMTNEQKAIVFEQTVPCHNNISLCCMQLKSYTESALFAKNGIMLITALEERTEEGLVWQCLLERGMTKNKLIKEWKIKSYFLAGKAELLRKEYEASIGHLEAALKLVEGDNQTTAEVMKLKELLTLATKKQSAELKKEKSTWAKAFQKNKDEPEVTPPLVEEREVPEEAKTIEEILKGINADPSPVKPVKPVVASPAREKKGKGLKSSPNRNSQVESEGAGGEGDREEEGEGVIESSDKDDSVSDETFGWLVGAVSVLSVVGLGAFLLLKSRQR